MESTMTTKGQITIPKSVRDRLRLEVGDKVYFDIAPDGSVRLVARNRPMEELFGMLRGRTVARRSPPPPPAHLR
jgi:AbrB family looped-hinge helix DNA binding protein